jgi:hypothetical protein
MRRILTILVGLPAILSAASAQEPTPVGAPLCAAAVQAGCQCAVLLPSSLGNGIARLNSMEGTVLVSRDANVTNATPNADLTRSDRVVTGENSTAQLLVAGSCAMSVPAQSIVTFSEVEGCACAMLTSNTGEVGAQAGPPPTEGGPGGGAILGLTAFGLAVTTLPGVVNELTDDDDEDDDDASPEPPAVN